MDRELDRDCNCSLYSLSVSPCYAPTHAMLPVLTEPKHLSGLLAIDDYSSCFHAKERELAHSTTVLMKKHAHLLEQVFAFISSCFVCGILTVTDITDAIKSPSLCVHFNVRQHILQLNSHGEILQCFSNTIEWYRPQLVKKFLHLLFEGKNNDIGSVVKKVELYETAFDYYFASRMFENGLCEPCPDTGKLRRIACIPMDSVWSRIPARDTGEICSRICEGLYKQKQENFAVWFCSTLYASVFEVDKNMLLCRDDCIQLCAPMLADVSEQPRMVGPCSEPHDHQLPYKVCVSSGRSQIYIEPPNPILSSTWLPEPPKPIHTTTCLPDTSPRVQ